MRVRIQGSRRFASLAILASIALSGCTVYGLDADGKLVTGSTTQSPPLDEIKGDLALGKEHFRNKSFGLAEKHFQRAVEHDAGNAEAWLGLAASYDRLRRFDLADRAYSRTFKLIGPTPEFLNNRGYSYLLRGDLKRASVDLSEAEAKSPEDERIRSNVALLRQRAGR